MRAAFEKFQKEENKKMMLLGAKVMKLHGSGEPIEEISKSTG
ncbi:hypothetical protein [Thalassobacillus sp. C254]|nr:hypothetical protein [Thalassobacillus sp. C254]